ncbi:hypothetical protein D0Y65_018713 [Glycine soja]|uniref:GCK domain-containing protein n=2 Tax=Glycine soja TaxID=3848 RepID=A0A445K0H5_GLYSO|nr:hypothetical protein JHK87_019451 [Glycine soja]RZC04229.1 hypothetical protein D0Y65_018713 [Glycine soja]
MSTHANQEPLNSHQPEAKPQDLPPDQPGSVSPGAEAEAEAEAGEEEEGECGFCLFMKGGGCRDEFVGWENCVEEAESNNEDLLEKCAQVTAALKRCMEAHSDYYEPIIRAEKLAEEQAIVELEKEKQNQQQPPPQDQKAEKVVEEVAIIELKTPKQSLTPNESQPPSTSSQDQK